LRGVIARTHSDGLPIRIVDGRCGCGRYLLETMRALPEIPMTALLRDYKKKPENVEAARKSRRSLA